MARGHPGVGLESLLQLAQRHAGDVRKFDQINRVFRRISRPLPYSFYDLAFVVASLQSAAIKAGVSVIKDEQAVLKQLLSQAIFIKWISSLRQLRENRA